ncbi:MAG: S8 family serine peptidase [Akkermansiaceae bacterium]
MKSLSILLSNFSIILYLLLPNAASAQEIIVINGKKASASGLMAKVKVSKKNNHSVKAQNFLLNSKLSVRKSFKSVPGLLNIRPAKTEKNQGEKRLKFTKQELIKMMKKLRNSGHFEYVEPDWILSVKQAPTDTAYTDGTLWGLKNTGQDSGTASIDVNAEPAWAITTGSPNIVVGVVDTGIRYTHQDLSGNMWVNPNEIAGNGIDDDNNGYIDDIYGINAIANDGDPMDDNDHGSHCAGTIAASANDAGRLVGVAYGVKLMALKFLDSTGSGATSDAIECIDYAIAQGVDVLSNSWGGGGASNAMLNAIEQANAAGVLFIAAAGNEASNTDNGDHFPSNYDVGNVISVAAIDRNGNLANFSNYGLTTVDIAAPGVEILSATSTSDGSYASFQGTSMATPHVAGVAALVLSRFPNASIAEQKNRILSTAAPLASLAGKTVTGGMVDALAALTVTEDGTLEATASTKPTPLIVEESATFFINVNDLVPISGATVTGSINSGSTIVFLDDGIAPDAIANDGVYSATASVPPAVTTVTLSANASKTGKTSFSGNFDFAVVTPPPNDDFANRSLLANGTVQTTGSNISATLENGEKINPASAGNSTVWWEYTAPFSANLTISTAGSDFDTTLAIYTGTASLADMTLVDSNDDASDLTSSVQFSAISGNKYYIQVSGYGAAEGNIILNYMDPGSAAGAPVITSQPKSRTVLLNEPMVLEVTAVSEHNLTYQWYKEMTAITGATTDSYEVASTTLADAGSYYVIITDTNALSTTSQTAVISVNPTAIRPVNDNFAEASLLDGESGRTTGTNTLATEESDEPDHAGNTTESASVWYVWTAPQAGGFKFDTSGSGFDTVMAIYSGTDLASLVELDSNDDASGLQSEVSVNALAGETYYIAVDGFDSEQGQITLNWSPFTPSTPGANDDFVNAQEFVGSSDQSDSFNNDAATEETNEPEHAGVGGTGINNNSLWWKWTAPSSGSVTISTAGSSYDTVLAAYSGNIVSALTELGSNDDFSNLQSQVTLSTVANQTYYFAVDGYGGSTGDTTVTLNFTPNDFLEWIAHYYTGANTNPRADPETDGVSNLVTYALGLKPGGAGIDNFGEDRLPVYHSINTTTGGISFTIPQTPPSDVTYRILESTDLVGWNPIATKAGASPWVLESGVTSNEEQNQSGAIKTTISSSLPFASSPFSYLRLEVSY